METVTKAQVRALLRTIPDAVIGYGEQSNAAYRAGYMHLANDIWNALGLQQDEAEARAEQDAQLEARYESQFA